MKNLHRMIVLALFSTTSASVLAAEPVECESPNHNSCFSFETEEIPMIDGYDMCQYRQQAGISTVYEGGTYFVTIDPNASGAAGVPLAYLPSHNGQWESWEQLNDSFEQLLFGTGCHGTPLPPFPTVDLCNPTGANFNFNFRSNVNWLNPSTHELIPNANMDAFYGAFSDIDGRIEIIDVGVFDLGGEQQCVTNSSMNGEGQVLSVKQCSKTMGGEFAYNNEGEIPCGPYGNDEQFPSLFEKFTSSNHFAYFEIDDSPTIVTDDGVELLKVDTANLENLWFEEGSLDDSTSILASDTAPYVIEKTGPDGTCGLGFVKHAGFDDIRLQTSSGTGTCP